MNPTEVSFSFPLTDPIVAFCTLMGERVSGEEGRAGHIQDQQRELWGALALTTLFSSPVVSFVFLTACPSLPICHWASIISSLLRRSPICLLFLPLRLRVLPPSVSLPCYCLCPAGAPFPTSGGPSILPGPEAERPNSSHFLPGFKREKYSCFSNQLWAA